jgi:hypothetical protein
MALVLYSDLYWFPNGAIASNTPAAVFQHHSNTLIPLFADLAGTIPLPNPLNTDAFGNLTFFAEEGKYWVHIDTETFLIDVGLSEEEADLSTGVATGGDMNIAPGNPQAVSIGALVGYVVDVNSLTSAVPSLVKVDEPTQTVPLDAAALTRALTNWLMDSAGNVIQQEPPPTPTQRRTHLQLGSSLYDPGLGSLVEVQSHPVVLGQPANQFADLLDAVRPFNVSGNVLSGVAGTLSFNMTSGEVWSRGINHFAAGVLTESPHISPTPARAPALFKRVIRVPEAPLPPDTTLVDPTMYDLNGILTPVGGGVNTSTVQRVFVVPSSSASAQVAVQYGQTTFTSLAAAVAAVGTTNYIPNPVSGVGALVGYIAMIRTATDLTSLAQAVFIRPNSKFPSY